MGVPTDFPDEIRAAMASGGYVTEPVGEPVADPVVQTIEQEDVPVARAAALIEQSLNTPEPEVEEHEPEEEPVEVADKALL
jgi:hypothetical protein